MHKPLLDSLVAYAARQNYAVKNSEDPKEKLKLDKILRSDPKFIDSVKKGETRLQASMICLVPQTGQILAMVGTQISHDHP